MWAWRERFDEFGSVENWIVGDRNDASRVGPKTLSPEYSAENICLILGFTLSGRIPAILQGQPKTTTENSTENTHVQVSNLKVLSL